MRKTEKFNDFITYLSGATQEQIEAVRSKK